MRQNGDYRLMWKPIKQCNIRKHHYLSQASCRNICLRQNRPLTLLIDLVLAQSTPWQGHADGVDGVGRVSGAHSPLYGFIIRSRPLPILSEKILSKAVNRLGCLCLNSHQM